MSARVKIYTRKWCGYCTAAIALLDRRKIAYDHVDASGDQATRAWLVDATGGRTTVPQIFIDGRSIGGCTELEAMDRSGELEKWLSGPVVED